MRYLLVIILFSAFSIFASAADLNGYTAVYEKNIGTPPPCDTIISSAGDANWAKLNDPSFRVICLKPGDYTSKGTIQLTANGALGKERWLRYYSTNDNGAHPVNQTISNRAILKRLVLDQVSYWVIHRITMDGKGQSVSNIELINGANNNILDRILNEKGGGASNGLFAVRDSDNNTIQNSVARKNNSTVKEDNDCIQLTRAYNNHIVNNEAYECSTKPFFIAAGGAPGTIVENNDFYVAPSQFTDCSGKYTPNDPNSRCAANETLISIKKGATPDNPIKVIHNRLWGSRKTDLSVCCNGGTMGQSVSLSTPGESAPPQAQYVLVENNIIMDGQIGIQTTRPGPNHNSVIGNIFYNIRNYRNSAQPAAAIDNAAGTNDEFYLNTIISAESWLTMGGGNKNSDIRCNVVMNSGARSGSGSDASTVIDNNAFYATPAYSTQNPSHDIVYPNVSDAKSTEVCFYRKLITSPEQICIPNAKPTTSSPHYLGCSQDIGSRKDIGINDASIF